MAAAAAPDSNVCFAELIVRLDSLLTLRSQEDQEQDEQAHAELEADIKLKLNELHLRLKNGGAIQDRSHLGEDDDEDEALNIDDSQGPSSANETSAIGSVDCVGCSSAEDEQNDSSPPPSQSFAKERQRKPSKTMKLLNHDNINALLRLSIMIFTKDIYSNQTLALAAQLIAEVCREPEGRKMALKYKAEISLVQSLGQVLAKPRSTETCVQVCRIIGNLCFDCNDGRMQIIAEASKIFDPLVKAFEDQEKISKEDPGQRLPVIFPGCLLNFCNETPQAVEVLARNRCTEAVIRNILQTKTNDAVFNSSILFIHAMIECESGIEHVVRCSKFSESVCHILTYTTSPEVCSTLFDMLKTCSESPAMVTHLAKGGLFQYMVNHMNDRLQSQAFLQLRITACDILVTMLAHDEAMQLTFNQDSKLFISTFLDWLKNGEDHPLKVTAALSMGNLCCSKENSRKVIGDFAPGLIEALKDHQAPLVRDVKLQHAILSALKNLCVDPEGRPLLVKAGILQPCLDLAAGLSLTPITQPVVMKLLATFRLLVDTEKEVLLAFSEERPDILSQIVTYSNHEGPGPRAESGRLLASIIKKSQNKKAMKNIIELGGLPAITVMLHSSHPIMVNESLMALTILTTSFASSPDPQDPALIHQHLHTDLIINGVKKIINHEDFPSELKANAATFMIALLKIETDVFKQMLVDLNFYTECFPEDKLPTMWKELKDLAKMLEK